MSSTKARVLFIGADYPGSNSTSLRNAILRHGHECLTLPMWEPPVSLRIASRLHDPSESRARYLETWNAHVAETADAWRPDVTVVFRGLAVAASTVQHLSSIKVHYHPDDSTSPYNRSSEYAAAEALYDLHVTTKSFNVSELLDRGVKRALYVRCAYDRDWHLPVPSREARYAVGFIGSRRPDRAPLISEIASRWGRQFHVAGGKWRRDLKLQRLATVTGPVMAMDFSLAVADAPVQLGLLNAYNRDLHTCRSYEVPAAGGVLIGERTGEHEEMLEDGIEARFFSSDSELFGILEELGGQPKLVAEIGQRAAERVRRDSSSYEDRWRQIRTELGL